MRRRTLLLVPLVVILAAGLIAGAVVLFSMGQARAMPVVRQATVALPDWPRGAPPIRVALLSDIHIGNRTMDADRLGRIVDRIAALHPDLVLIAGDFIAGARARTAVRVAPALVSALGRLRAPLGTVAVFGNHDVEAGRAIVGRTLGRAGVIVLQNDAVVRGPLAIAGAGDVVTGEQDIAATWRRLRPLAGARVVLTHSPQGAETFPADAHLVLTGHTHCGQVVLPLVGTLDRIERMRYWCGLYRDGARTVVVTAGLGTTGYPVRFGAPPDVWLLTLGPARAAAAPVAQPAATGLPASASSISALARGPVQSSAPRTRHTSLPLAS